MIDRDIEASMILQERIYQYERSKNSMMLHLYFKEDEMLPDPQNYVYNEITIPEGVAYLKIYFNVKKLILPTSLNLIDYQAPMPTDLECNIPPNIDRYIIENINIIGKEFYELFPFLNSDESNGYMYDNNSMYIDCSLNGVKLNTIINTKYTKYFNKTPQYITPSSNESNEYINRNIIRWGLHSSIIREIIEYEATTKYTKYFCKAPQSSSIREIMREIIEYEARIKQGREFRLAVKEELVAMAWHPRRVDRWIHADIDLLDL